MKLRALVNTNLSEGGEVKPGDVYELPDEEALEHVSRRWAVAIETGESPRGRRWRGSEGE